VQFGKLCSLILLEHFGEIVQTVGNDLYKCQSKPLRLIVASTKLPLQKVLNTTLTFLVLFTLT
jgi:DNA-directed RNA polymerase III subunit RPC3